MKIHWKEAQNAASDAIYLTIENSFNIFKTAKDLKDKYDEKPDNRDKSAMRKQ
ncbi:hypothetical protein OM416_27770 [Paenibacillus sp. LS1]|uniref:hypothetical protein n=1 Tax=Paenibacillus sp. LS1 TaxID=2992120 RepID=UPI002231C07E|nr:hypothetical protein [Paenibacillus sp. LS1]MCW3795411.1 hypothetical protein [Paenibacillus sp. LS1]